jgi:hypothetical protein
MATKILILGVLTLTALAVSSATRPTTAPVRSGRVYPPDGKIDAALKQRLPLVRMKQVSLEEAIERLRADSGANLFVDWHALKATNIDRSTRVDVDLQDVSLAQALDYIVRSIFILRNTKDELWWDVQDNVIVISSEASIGHTGSIRVYDIRDLMKAELGKLRVRWEFWMKGYGTHPPPNAPRVLVSSEPTWDVLAQAIMMLITDQVAEDTWKDNGGSIGTIRELNGRLIVRQTWQNHQKVEALLDELREKGIPTTSPSSPAGAPPGGGSQ